MTNLPAHTSMARRISALAERKDHHQQNDNDPQQFLRFDLKHDRPSCENLAGDTHSPGDTPQRVRSHRRRGSNAQVHKHG